MQMQGEYVKELVLERVVDAPRERAWEAWTGELDSLAKSLAKA